MAEQQSQRSTASSVVSEDYGERLIKSADSAQAAGATGVGRCALHPCLVRRATIAADGARPGEAIAALGIGRPGSAAELRAAAGEAGAAGAGAEAGGAQSKGAEDSVLEAKALGGAQDALADGLARCEIESAAGAGRGRRTPSVSQAQAQLELKRQELARAGKRSAEAAAARTMERGVRSGADTPTVDLVQTAVSVREVSKLIGRTVVQVSNVRRIMIVTKPNDTSLVSLTRDLATWLVESPLEDGAAPMVVYIEEFIAQHRNFGMARALRRHPALRDSLQFWTPELCARSPEIFDFVVTLGGDGTVLYTSWLFQTTVPPIIPFHLGSLGFLTVFDHRHARRVLGSAIRVGVRINLRMRFTCTVYRLAEEVDPAHANVLAAAADRNRIISHGIATRGLRSDDEHTDSANEDDARCASDAARLAAASSLARPKGSRRPYAGAAAAAAAPRRRTASSSSSSSASSTAGAAAAAHAVAAAIGIIPGPATAAAAAPRHGSGSARASYARRRSEADPGSPDAGSADTEMNHPPAVPRRTTSISSGSRPLRKRGSQLGSQLGSASTSASSSRAATAVPPPPPPPPLVARSRSSASAPRSRSSAMAGAIAEEAPAVARDAAGQTLGTKDAAIQTPGAKDAAIQTTLGAKHAASEPPELPPKGPAAAILDEAARHQAESEWDDVPRAYQRRVRKVWKRDSTFQVMNEVVVDRGPSPYLSQIELYGDGSHLTTVEADGLCLATPTGSTAYSLAAGGSLVHPEIPAILVTPICPHTLSFRPMLLPDSMVLRVVLPPDSRNTAWASFDGRHRIELRRGDHIQITASKYPLPTVCASQSQTQDWMASLSRCLNWNERKRQKKFSSSATAAADRPECQPNDASEDGGNIGDNGSDPGEDDDRDDDDDDDDNVRADAPDPSNRDGYDGPSW
ncbi:hypothetical protein H4R18_002092 [Coemansia javaensis]|uniref:ATP-NAD kinase n=1 Tax=Coemansia javaensis TaxID=2761396 RepID=A0A9W8HDY1_9FUNG|nr:hypothetical protein H4R18_002092 [Coemansia javaensis]